MRVPYPSSDGTSNMVQQNLLDGLGCESRRERCEATKVERPRQLRCSYDAGVNSATVQGSVAKFPFG